MLNLIRACEQAIDMANRVTLLRGLPVADDTADSLIQLGKAGLVSDGVGAVDEAHGRFPQRRRA